MKKFVCLCLASISALGTAALFADQEELKVAVTEVVPHTEEEVTATENEVAATDTQEASDVK
ncbi:MAG: hypothetical protein AAF443_02340 [Chlamydiota bacterium]